MDLLITVLSSSAVAALIGLGGNLLIRWLDGKKTRKSNVDKRLSALEEADRAILRDRIRYLGRLYIKDKQIDLEDREDLMCMHKAYKSLGGNGNLNAVMESVMELPLL